MTVAAYILAAGVLLLSIGQIFLEYILQYITKDARTKENKTLRKTLLCITLALFVGNEVVDKINDTAKQRRADKDKQTYEAKISSLSSNFEARIAPVNASQTDLLRQHRELVTALVTNSSIAAETRERVQAAGKQFEVVRSSVVDLNEWVTDLKKRRAMTDLQAKEIQKKHDEVLWSARAPVFEHIIRRLESILVELGKQRGETLVSSYKGLPRDQASGLMGELKLGTNASWQFFIRVEPNLSVQTRHAAMSAAVNPSQVIIGGDGGAFDRAYTDYKDSAEQALRDFLAVNDMRSGL